MVSAVARSQPGLVRAVSRLRWRAPWLWSVVDLAARSVRNRDASIGRGAGAGLRFNCGSSSPAYVLGTAEPGVQAALVSVLEPGRCFYDVGANVGFMSMIAARLVSPSGRVVCFEPLPSNADLVAHNAELNGFEHVHVCRHAVGSTSGRAEFIESDESGWGKLASAGVPGRAKSRRQVEVRTLDDLAKTSDLLPPDVMKIDVEGAELAVLEGGAETIARHRPVLLVELHGTGRTVAPYLNHHGYTSVLLGSHEEPGACDEDAYIVAMPAEHASEVERFRDARYTLHSSA